jgi:hypothetical protein
MKTFFAAACLLASVALSAHAGETPTPSALPTLKELQAKIARFVPVKLKADVAKLSKGDQKALAKIVEASRILDPLFMSQLWKGSLDLAASLKQDSSALGKARSRYFQMNLGPWSEIDDNVAFVPGAPAKKLEGANFYPEDMTKAEFEKWEASLPKAEQDRAKNYFTVIRRDGSGKLSIVPYSQEYKVELSQVVALLREASALTDNATLKKYLSLRADALLSDDYYASDIAWMDVDAPLDVTIGPYETYNDAIFGYKAAFESFIGLRDEVETDKLQFFSGKLQEIENNLPIDPKYRNPKIGATAPIRVVNQVIATGDANHGVRTAAYNLPNDERVIAEKGSKRVMLKNIQEAKFKQILTPISKIVLEPAELKYVSFESFFTHILAHELSHGLGPHQIKTADGKDSTPRLELKELYSAVEEAKADVTGLFMLQYLFDHDTSGKIKGGADAERRLYTTYLASCFRTLRFGLQDAHARGMAMQINYLLDRGGFTITSERRFAVNYEKVKGAFESLSHDLLTLEATGDYAGTKAMLDKLAVVRPELAKALEGLKKIPTDIFPQPAL